MEKLQIAQMLYAQRIFKKKTQTQCGAKLGVTFQQFQKYEKAMNGIPSEKLFIFCNAFNINANVFQDGDPYSFIESADIHPALKEKHYIKLNELETKMKREQTNDKDRSQESMVRESFHTRTHI